MNDFQGKNTCEDLFFFFFVIEMGHEVIYEKWKYSSPVRGFLHLEFLIL